LVKTLCGGAKGIRGAVKKKKNDAGGVLPRCKAHKEC